MKPSALAGLLLSVLICAPAAAQISDDVVRIGVLTDEGDRGTGEAGPGSVAAARLAAEAFGGSVRGKRIEIVQADTKDDPEIAGAIARRWFDEEGVDAVIDLPTAAVAGAVLEAARQRNRTVMITAAAAGAVTPGLCLPVATHWSADPRALAAATVRALLAQGGASWFLLTADGPAGRALARDATEALRQAGATLLGEATLGDADADAAALLRAQASGAKVVGLAASGPELAGLLHEAETLGLIGADAPALAGLRVDLRQVHALGLAAAQGLRFAAGFYWDQDDEAREFAQRFFARQGAMPGQEHALIYTAVTQYLRAIDAVGTDDAVAVNRAMRERPFGFFGRPASIRGDGRVLYDETLWRVKPPAQSRAEWDLADSVRTMPAAEVAPAPNREACGG